MMRVLELFLHTARGVLAWQVDLVHANYHAFYSLPAAAESKSTGFSRQRATLELYRTDHLYFVRRVLIYLY